MSESGFDNISDPMTQKGIRDRILSYIYGEIDYSIDMRVPINHNTNNLHRKHYDLEKVLAFNIAVEDIVMIADSEEKSQPSSVFDIPAISE